MALFTIFHNYNWSHGHFWAVTAVQLWAELHKRVLFVGGGPPVGNVGSNGGGHLMDLAGTYDAKPDKVCPPPYSTLQANICAHTM